MSAVVLHRTTIPDGSHVTDGRPCPCRPLVFDHAAVGAHPSRPWWVRQASGMWRRVDGLEIEPAHGESGDALTQRLILADGPAIGEDWA